MSAANVFLSLEKVEDHPSGYPRLACLIGSHPSFYIFRRFSAIRARMLLYQQDKISQLEEKLQTVDENEQKVIFHGSWRRDTNHERIAIIDQLETAIADYDSLLARTRDALNTRSARERDVVNLRDWINSSGCLSREESKYLWKSDLVSVTPFEPDSLLQTLSDSVEDYIIWISSRIHKDLRTHHSRDPNMHIFPERLIRTLTRVILALFASATVLVPILLFSLVKSEGGRLALIVPSIMIFVGVLSLVARPKVSEIFVAGATFAAVVVVYVSGSDN